MAEQDQNRNEQATPFKREEARKQGNVPKSLDFNSFMMLLGGTVAIHAWGGSMSVKELRLFESIFSNAHHTVFDIDHLGTVLVALLVKSLSTLAPALVLVCTVAVFSNVVQTGPIFSWVPLKPKLERLNPIEGFKRLFSMRLLIESVKTMLKFLLLGAVLYYALKASMPALITGMNMTPGAISRMLATETSAILFKLVAALAVVMLIDLVFSRWEFSRKLRMSRREITDEHKRREGDPRIKSRLRELQREMLKRASSAGKVKDADVLIVNPVHLAVAIRYEKDEVDAPLVIAKGAGFLARRMKEAARRHQVPVVENKALARALFFKVKIDQTVPTEHFNALAKILVWVFALRKPAEAAR